MAISLQGSHGGFVDGPICSAMSEFSALTSLRAVLDRWMADFPNERPEVAVSCEVADWLIFGSVRDEATPGVQAQMEINS